MERDSMHICSDKVEVKMFTGVSVVQYNLTQRFFDQLPNFLRQVDPTKEELNEREEDIPDAHLCLAGSSPNQKTKVTDDVQEEANQTI